MTLSSLAAFPPLAPRPSSPPAAERILLIRPSALGDVCKTVPVLMSLRRTWPEARLDWLVRDSYTAAIAAHPALDRVVPFPRETLGRSPRRMLAFARALRAERYDVVLDCQGLLRSALFALATRARVRVGPRGAREMAWIGYNRRPATMPEHTVDAMLALVEAIGGTVVTDPTLHVVPEDETFWRERVAAWSGGRVPYAVLAPTARWASKRWPIERWNELMRWLIARGCERVVVIGAPGEESQVAPLTDAGHVGLVDEVGRLTIGQTMAAIASAEAVVANDSAPLHMAVGFNRPCLGLFGPTDPARVGPYRRENAVLAAKGVGNVNYRDPSIGDRLMREISVDAVCRRLEEIVPFPIGVA